MYILINKWNQLTNQLSIDEQIILGLVLSIFLSSTVTVVVMFAIIGYLIWQGRINVILETVEGAYYLLAFCLITLSVSLINHNQQGVLIAIIMGGFFIVSLYIRTVMTRVLFEKIIDLSCAASLLGFVVIAFQRLADTGGGAFRASSVFLNANFYATVTELIVLLCVYKMLQPTTKHRGHYLIVLLFNLCGLYLSNCRSAVIALGFSVLVLLLLNKRYMLCAATLTVEAAIATALCYIPGALSRIDQSGPDLVNRLSIWITAVKGISNHPFFGQGARTYEIIHAQYGGPETVHAHSLFLDPLLNFGIVGIIILAVYYKENLKSIMRMSGHRQDQKRLHLIVAVMTSVVIHGMTDITLFSVQVGLLLSILLAVAGIRENQPAIRRLIPSLRCQKSRTAL